MILSLKLENKIVGYKFYSRGVIIINPDGTVEGQKEPKEEIKREESHPLYPEPTVVPYETEIPERRVPPAYNPKIVPREQPKRRYLN
ncbi:hypothetical protein COV93_08765 [Candidatus Woesearchaeota archaeon CG11_big_fil_rev_8_21_14_0_20_43_8]|nr:MAG: hypothetical protein COV93_08765 [Candidatus Woesearchaeota archaeon CG11_big_fil_rev_8_21_14_0_20_43_8]PIO04582.1 MAG: hypothetical protein COT47_08390 [Candidatus Woesearchaeota archaeon CG08_land_8_20_14_0_20_43_7]